MRSRFAVRRRQTGICPPIGIGQYQNAASQTLNPSSSTIFPFISKRQFDVVFPIQDNSSCIPSKASQHNLWCANNRLPSNCQCPATRRGWELSFLFQSSPLLPSLSRSLLPQISSRRRQMDIPLLCNFHDDPNSRGILDGSLEPRYSNQR